MVRLVDFRIIQQTADPVHYNHQEPVIMEANNDAIQNVLDDNLTTLSSGNISSGHLSTNVEFPQFSDIFEPNLQDNNIHIIQGNFSSTNFLSRREITCSIFLENGGEIFHLNCRDGGFHSLCLSTRLRS